MITVHLSHELVEKNTCLVRVYVLVSEEYVEVNMACVKCFQEHDARNTSSKPIEIWRHDLFKPFGPISFLPIENIQEVCVTCDILVNDEVVIAVNPMKEKIFM